MSLAMFKGPTVAGPTQNRSVMLGGRHDRDGDDALDWSIGAGRGWRKLSGYPGGHGSCLADRTMRIAMQAKSTD